MDRPLLLTVGMHCLAFRRIALPILVGALVAQAGGCKTSSLEKTDARDGHAAPDSAIDRTDSGDAGPDSGVLTCAADPAAPVSSSGTPRRTMPWLFVASTRDGAAAADGGPGGGDAGASGCTTGAAAMSGIPFGNLSNVTCAGSATARVSGGNIDLVFADGAVLRWDTTGVANPEAPPALSDGATASIDYHRTWMIVCPVCGAYYTATMQIRTGSDQKLIWVALEGTEISDVDADLVSELFGVTFSEKLNCESTFGAYCNNAVRRTFDHILHTTPPQTIPAAALRRVTTPRGDLDVVWAHSTEVVTPIPNCADGPIIAHDTGFAASRIPSPDRD
jgi:hypothetical protein